MNNIYIEFLNKIEQFDTFTLLMHNNPDGDSVASMFAMKDFLEKKGKKVQLAIHNYIPENFKFWFDKYINKIIIPSTKSDCLIIVDTPNPEKTYSKYSLLADYVIVIDHHKNSLKFGDFNLCRKSTCTGYLIYQILKADNFKIDKRMAEYLYISMCWDTDGFKNSVATSEIYNIASKLIELGAVPQRVFKYLFDYKKRNEVDIKRRLYNNIEERGKIHYIKITRDFFKEMDNSDINNFLSSMKLIESMELFVMFIDRGEYFEIKMNNNQYAYIYLKNRYKRLYKIYKKISFEDDTEDVLESLEDILK